MAVPFLFTAIPLPTALGLYNGRFFTEYPLTLGTLDPGFSLPADAAAAQIIDGTPASDKDFDTEYLDYILAVGVVDSLDAAIAHVLAHSTHHSDAIVTEDAASAERFINGTDSAATYVNVSTALPTGVSSASAARWASPRRSSTPAAPWGSTS